ncbi:hypothetical protein [Candidatus Xenohaliotis californiensis]|uniref:hypothetical protein n=1 Tax=Candidatus Xenohaliotis californiensis TaxID=84677 RepID=UPI0030C83C2E
MKTEELKTHPKMSMAAHKQIKKFPHLDGIFVDPDAEKKFFIKYEDEKFHHTGRIDFYSPKFATLIDYKTTSYSAATKGLWRRK